MVGFLRGRVRVYVFCVLFFIREGRVVRLVVGVTRFLGFFFAGVRVRWLFGRRRFICGLGFFIGGFCIFFFSVGRGLGFFFIRFYLL